MRWPHGNNRLRREHAASAPPWLKALPTKDELLRAQWRSRHGE